MATGSRLVTALFAAITLAAAGNLVAADQRSSVEPSVPTFSRDVAPIVFQHCVVCHHPGAAVPFSLLTYKDARSRANLLASVTKKRYMPPWKPERGYGSFVGARRLSDEDIDVIGRWAAAGAPEGSSADLPSTPRWTEGWQLGTPDLIVRMTEPFELAAQGPDVFRNFVIPLPVETVRYVKALEFHPGDLDAVHHATMFIDKTPASRERDEDEPGPGYAGMLAPSADFPDGHFLGWTHGQQIPPVAEDLAWRLDAGSDMVLQLHLKPTGKPERVQATVGLYFTAKPPARTLSMLRMGRQDLDIPAGAAANVVTDSYVLPIDVDVFAVQPHAHYRAREVKAFARLPNGTTEWLIYIRDWDFDWQDMYYYVRPVSLPKGTTISVELTYDNSADNPRNPQIPPRRVRWGPNSTDEMGDVLIQLATRSSADSAVLASHVAQKHLRDDITGRETMLSVEPDDALVHDDLALLYMEQGNATAAIAHLREAVRLTPASPARHANLGRELTVAGLIKEAAQEYAKVLQLAPRDVAGQVNLGVALVLEGRLNEALAHFQSALELDPRYAEAHNNLGSLLLHVGRTQEALEHLRRALEIRPGFPDARYNLARGMLAVHNPEEASRQFDEALRLRPDWPAALKDRAWMLATHPDEHVRDARRAVRLAEQAVELTNHGQPTLLDVLAAAYAADGQFDRALTTARAALELLGADSREAATVKQRLTLYQRMQPYIDVLPASSDP